jgi:hypothetical protein
VVSWDVANTKIYKSLVWLDWGSNPRSTTLKSSTLIITSLMRLFIIKRNPKMLRFPDKYTDGGWGWWVSSVRSLNLSRFFSPIQSDSHDRVHSCKFAEIYVKYLITLTLNEISSGARLGHFSTIIICLKHNIKDFLSFWHHFSLYEP